MANVPMNETLMSDSENEFESPFDVISPHKSSASGNPYPMDQRKSVTGKVYGGGQLIDPNNVMLTPAGMAQQKKDRKGLTGFLKKLL